MLVWHYGTGGSMVSACLVDHEHFSQVNPMSHYATEKGIVFIG